MGYWKILDKWNRFDSGYQSNYPNYSVEIHHAENAGYQEPLYKKFRAEVEKAQLIVTGNPPINFWGQLTCYAECGVNLVWVPQGVWDLPALRLTGNYWYELAQDSQGNGPYKPFVTSDLWFPITLAQGGDPPTDGTRKQICFPSGHPSCQFQCAATAKLGSPEDPYQFDPFVLTWGMPWWIYVTINARVEVRCKVIGGYGFQYGKSGYTSANPPLLGNRGAIVKTIDADVREE